MMRVLALTSFVVCVVLAVGCNSRPSATTEAAAYPRKTVTLICPWAAGGGTDRVSRFWADAFRQEFGKPFVVVNRTGGSGAIGHSVGASAAPDGHTITMVTFELGTMHQMGITDLTYQDFHFLLQMNGDPAAILVRDDAPWTSLQQWLEHIRSNPGQLKMSGTATGGAWDLARAGLLMAADLPINSTIWVPNDGAAPSLVELLGGHIEAVCCSVPEAAAQIEGGQVRALAVMADERLPNYPDVPTVREAGYDWVAVGWRGLAVPRGTPPAIVSKLEERCLAIAESAGFKDFMAKNRFEIEVRGAEEFAKFARQQDEQWMAVIKAAGYATD